MNDQNKPLQSLLGRIGKDRSFERLLSPGQPQVLYSGPVMACALAYGQAMDAHKPRILAASQQCYDDALRQGASTEEAEQAAFSALINAFLTIPIPLPGSPRPQPGTSKALCNPPVPEDFDQGPQDDGEHRP